MSPHRIESSSSDSHNGLDDPEPADVGHRQAIAVIGFDLRFPQDGDTPAGFWRMMEERRDAMTDFPPSRFNIDSFHDPCRRPATIPMRGAHFLKEDIGAFDAEFFSIAPSEASAMDPQHRMLLEATYRAFENAGIRVEDIKGSNTSVITGSFTSDYFSESLRDAEDLPPSMAIGSTLSMLANRLSWFFDLNGPSYNLDSACASSAMAVQQACEQLEAGDCDLAVVAASNLILDPDFCVALGNMNFVSTESRSFAFDHRANGYSRGEGVGVIILQRTEDAVRSKNSLRAVIRAARSNQDGRTPGITQPSGPAQRRLIEETYQRAGLSMRHTRFFEAHGTGTAIGDPAEANAIIETFSQHRSIDDPIYIGAVKTNIGHLEGASGIAALLKTVMILESGRILPNTNFEKINPQIYNSRSCAVFPQEVIVWPSCQIRRASISSFGYGGSNCHIVMDDAYSYLESVMLSGRHRTIMNGIRITRPLLGIFPSIRIPAATTTSASLSNSKRRLLLLSAASEKSLRRTIAAWQDYLSEKLTEGQVSANILSDIVYTLGSRRSRLQYRAPAVVDSISDFINVDTSSIPIVFARTTPSVAFVFTGQGAQWHAMGRELLQYEAFATHIDESTRLLHSIGCTWSVRGKIISYIKGSLYKLTGIDELFKTERESRISDPDLAQPLTAIIQIGLVMLLKLAEVRPLAVVGHSMGEIAAAYSIGLFNSTAATKLAYYRGQLVASLPQRDNVEGGMLAAGLGAQELQPYFARVKTPYAKYPLLASCLNSSTNTTVSGEVRQLEELRIILEADGIFARRLRVSAAYHSTQLDQIAADCLELFKDITFSKERLTGLMISTVSGRPVDKQTIARAEYWVENMISPVAFMQAISYLCKQASPSPANKLDGSHRSTVFIDTILEIGPHSALALPIKQTTSSLSTPRNIRYLAPLLRNKPADKTFLEVLGALWSAGAPVVIDEFNKLDEDTRKFTTQLEPQLITDGPRYPFDHGRSFWHESSISRNYRLKSRGPLSLLGQRMREWRSFSPEWRHRINAAYLPWLSDHTINGSTLYPAAAMILAAIKAAKEVASEPDRITAFLLHDIRFHIPIILSTPDSVVDTRCTLISQKRTLSASEPRRSFSLYFLSQDEWQLACTCMIDTQQLDNQDVAWRTKPYKISFQQDSDVCNQRADQELLYERWKSQGFGYQGAFQGIRQASHDGDSRAVGTVSLAFSEEEAFSGSSRLVDRMEPGSLDSILQMILVVLTKGGEQKRSGQVVDGIERMWISNNLSTPQSSTAEIAARVTSSTARHFMGEIFVLNPSLDRLLATFSGLRTTTVTSSSSHTRRATEDIGSCFLIERDADLSFSSPRQILGFLDGTCGKDTEGPVCLHKRLHKFVTQALLHIDTNTEQPGTILEKSHLRRYKGWIKHHLANSPHRQNLGNGVPTLKSLSVEEEPVTAMFMHVANSCLQILREDNAVEMLFQNNLAARFYEAQSTGSRYYHKLARYLQSAAFVNPQMEVLEVGAGTGSFTQHVLSALEEPSEPGEVRLASYTFSDISPAFFGEAGDKFIDYKRYMNYRVLDIQTDLAQQGFQGGRYDMILASNVLHLCEDLETSLRSLRTLLKPGGKLILHENTCPEKLESGFIFGLTKGWWLEGDDKRKLSPLHSLSEWDRVLKSTGFSGSELAIPDFINSICHTMNIIITEASKSTASRVSLDRLTLLTTNASPSELRLAKTVTGSICQLTDIQVVPEVKSFSQINHTFQCPNVMVSLLEYDQHIFSHISKVQFSRLRIALKAANVILWVTRGAGLGLSDPHHGAVRGFFKVFNIENPTKRTLILKLDPADSEASAAQSIALALNELITSGNKLEEILSVTNGIFSVERTAKAVATKSKILSNLTGTTTTKKQLKQCLPYLIDFCGRKEFPLSVTFDHTGQDLPHKTNIKVRISHISIALAMQEAESPDPRMVYSGIAGTQRVCFLAKRQFRSTVCVPRSTVVETPDHVSSLDAVAILEDCCLALSLVQSSIAVSSSASLLICAPQSRLRDAIIILALKIPCDIYITVTSVEEMQSIEDRFHLGLAHIVHKDDVVGRVCRANSVKMSCIINVDAAMSSADLALCIAPFGRIIKHNLGTATGSSLSLPNSNVEVRCTNRTILQHPDYGHDINELHRLFDTVCNLKTVERSERIIQISELLDHPAEILNLSLNEKVIVDLSGNDIVQPYQFEWSFDASASYVIVGGFGDLGRCVVKWMAGRGARNLVILSRNGPRSDASRQLVQELTNLGVTVFSPPCDVSNTGALATALKLCQEKLPKVRGCIQLSGAIKDVTYDKMSHEDWEAATKPKITGSWNLHELLPDDMDFFILSSSISGVLGQATQINYAAANAFQDALAIHRNSMGMKTVSLDFGLLLVGGLLAQTPSLLDRLMSSGQYDLITQVQIIAIFEYYCNPATVITSLSDSQLIVGVRDPADIINAGHKLSEALQKPCWSLLRRPTVSADEKEFGPDSDASGYADIAALLTSSDSPEAAVNVVLEGLVRRLGSTLSIPAANITADQAIHTYGADSLTAIDLKNWVFKKIGVDLPVFDILGDMSIKDMAQFIVHLWGKLK